MIKRIILSILIYITIFSNSFSNQCDITGKKLIEIIKSSTVDEAFFKPKDGIDFIQTYRDFAHREATLYFVICSMLPSYVASSERH